MPEEGANNMNTDNSLLELGPGANDAPVSAPMGVAMIALNFALKYHDINTVQDGTLYQQYKLEGKNLSPLHLDVVFETAKRIERHLLCSSSEIAEIMVSGVMEALDFVSDEVGEADVPATGEPT